VAGIQVLNDHDGSREVGRETAEDACERGETTCRGGDGDDLERPLIGASPRRPLPHEQSLTEQPANVAGNFDVLARTHHQGADGGAPRADLPITFHGRVEVRVDFDP